MATGTAAQLGVQFTVLVVLARLLSPADFGIVTAALTVVGLSSIFSQLGVGPALVQRSVLEKRHIHTAFTLSLVLGVLFYGAILVTAPFIEAFFRMEGLGDVLRLLGLVFPVKALGMVAESLAQRQLRFRLLSVAGILSYTLGYAVPGIICAVRGFGPYALVVAHLAQAVTHTGMLLLLQRHSLVPLLEVRALRELMYFGSGMTVARLGNYLAGQADYFVVGRLFDASSLGLYSRAYQLMMIPVNLVGTVLDKVLFPAMASIQHDEARLAGTYRRGLWLVALLTFPMSAFSIVYTPALIRLVLGSEWLEATRLSQILLSGLFFRTGYKISDSLARATGAVYRRAWRQWIYAAAVFAFSVIGSSFGLPGVAAGVTGAIVLNYVLMAHLSAKLASLHWKAFVEVVLPGLVLGIASFSVSLIALWLVPLDVGSMVVAAFGICCLTVLLVRGWPEFFLGDDGGWLAARAVRVIQWVARRR